LLPVHAAVFARPGPEVRFDAALPALEDWDFWLRLSHGHGYRFTRIPTIGAVYHRTTTATSMLNDVVSGARPAAQFSRLVGRPGTKRPGTERPGLGWLAGLDLAGTTVEEVLHTTDKTLLAAGHRGGRPVVVKALTSTDPFWRRNSPTRSRSTGTSPAKTTPGIS